MITPEAATAADLMEAQRELEERRGWEPAELQEIPMVRIDPPLTLERDGFVLRSEAKRDLAAIARLQGEGLA